MISIKLVEILEEIKVKKHPNWKSKQNTKDWSKKRYEKLRLTLEIYCCDIN